MCSCTQCGYLCLPEAAAEQLEAEECSLRLTIETHSSAQWRIWSLENQESERLRKRLTSNHQVGKRDQGSLYCSRSYTIINSVLKSKQKQTD